MTHDTKLNLHQRLHAVMGEVDYIQKERKQGMRYTIVSHDAVTAKVRPILHKFGVLYYPVRIDCGQTGNRTEMNMAVRFVNVDDAADAIEVATAGYGIDDQDKGPGKAISYAVKYALLKTLGLETGDDPDNDQDVRHVPDARAAPKPAARPVNVERDRHFGNAAEEIRSGQNGTPRDAPPAKVGDPRAWAGSADAGDFLRDARADLSLVKNGDDMRRWMEANRWEHDAILEHGDGVKNKAGVSRTAYLNKLIGEAQDRCRANALPTDGLRGAA